jgi:hypothetical protein
LQKENAEIEVKYGRIAAGLYGECVQGMWGVGLAAGVGICKKKEGGCATEKNPQTRYRGRCRDLEAEE